MHESPVVVDPRGSVTYSSMLFAGSMSDKEIFIQSGFQSQLKNLVYIGYLKEGHGIKGDKGFDITKEVEDTKNSYLISNGQIFLNACTCNWR